MPYREKADLLAEISRELSAFSDPRGEVTGRVGLVESDASTAGTGARPAAPPSKPKLTAS